MFSKHQPSGTMLSISQFVLICVCRSVCLFTFEVTFNCIFPPHFPKLDVHIFRDFESFGKSNGQKWSQILKLLQINGLNRGAKKIVFWANFALLSSFCLVSVFLTLFTGLFCPTSRGPMSTLFRFSESLGKSNGKKWSKI